MIKKRESLELAGIWKFWALCCVAEASRFGMSPMTSSKLHVVLYLANTLAEFYEVTRVRGKVLKRGKYPFFPDVQREIDFLALTRILVIDSVRFESRGSVIASYSLGEKGVEIYNSILEGSEEAKRTAMLFRELLNACYSRFLSSREDIGLVDANYADAKIITGEVVDFSEWSDINNNLKVARYLLQRLKSVKPAVRRDGVRLYCEYIHIALEAA